MPKISFKGINIHYTEQGRGNAVVLLHGFLESIPMWNGLLPGLMKRHRVVCIDLPGHGDSECIGYVHTMDEMAEAVREVIRHLKLRRVSLLGHSMGGYVALAYAETFPDEVKTLVLYQSTAKADSKWKKRDRLRAMALIKQNHKSFIRQSIPALFRPVNRKRYRSEINELKEEALKMPLQGIIAALDGMRQRPSRELLLKFPPYPVHIVASDRDPRIPLDECIELSKLSESVELHVLKGCGHMSYIENKEGTLALFKKIL